MRIHVIAAIATASVLSLLSSSGAQSAPTKGHRFATATGAAKSIRMASVGIASASHRPAAHRSRRGAYLIPPPPAYMPCILPELYAHSSGTGVTEIAVAKKPENPYKKYVKTPTGDAPEPLQVRKGVATWNWNNKT